MSLTRRDVLSLGALAAAHAALPLRSWAQAPPDVELELTASPAAVSILPGRRTDVWQFTGRVIKGPATALEVVPDSYLGPTIRVSQGQQVRIRFRNRLPDPSIVHWHGLDVPEAADGHPRLAIDGGRDYVYDFQVTNRAGTYWYHPHPHMQTGPQVYSGLAGLFIVSDAEERAVGLPQGPQELVAVIQDRRFDASNQLVYSTSMMDLETGMLGDRVLINGLPSPQWPVAATAHRLRILNGSNARIYKLVWSDGSPLTVLGVDGGLLERPVQQPFVTLAPAQRLDVWIDLSGQPLGTVRELRSEAFPVADAGLDMAGMMGGRMGGMGRGRGSAMGGAASATLGAPMSLLTLRVAQPAPRVAAAPPVLPSRLSAPMAALRAGRGPVRQIPLTFRMMEWFLGGRAFGMDDVAADETVAAGSVHDWEFVNAGGPMGMQMAHPIHVHGRQFQVISRTGAPGDNALRAGLLDQGWVDTVLVLPGETVRIRIPFSTHRGLFLYHCHILEHEDMGMMRNYRIV
jgi:blue copper oxidase